MTTQAQASNPTEGLPHLYARLKPYNPQRHQLLRGLHLNGKYYKGGDGLAPDTIPEWYQVSVEEAKLLFKVRSRPEKPDFPVRAFDIVTPEQKEQIDAIEEQYRRAYLGLGQHPDRMPELRAVVRSHLHSVAEMEDEMEFNHSIAMQRGQVEPLVAQKRPDGLAPGVGELAPHIGGQPMHDQESVVTALSVQARDLAIRNASYEQEMARQSQVIAELSARLSSFESADKSREASASAGVSAPASRTEVSSFSSGSTPFASSASASAAKNLSVCVTSCLQSCSVYGENHVAFPFGVPARRHFFPDHIWSKRRPDQGTAMQIRDGAGMEGRTLCAFVPGALSTGLRCAARRRGGGADRNRAQTPCRHRPAGRRCAARLPHRARPGIAGCDAAGMRLGGKGGR